MADYRDLLRRAIEALPENNGNARRQVYDKARTALRKQLDDIRPELPSREKTFHRLQLEECIREVEQEATERMLRGLSHLEEMAFGTSEEKDTEADTGLQTEEIAAAETGEAASDEHAEETQTDFETPPDAIAQPTEPEAAEPVIPVTTEVESDAAESSDSPVDADEAASESEADVEPERSESPVIGEPPAPEAEAPAATSSDSAFAADEALPPLSEAPVDTDTDAVEDASSAADESGPKTGEETETDAVLPVEDDDAKTKAAKQNAVFARFSEKIASFGSGGGDSRKSKKQDVDAEADEEAGEDEAPAMSAEREVDLDTDDGEIDADAQMAIDHAIAVLDREASGQSSTDDPSIETIDPELADVSFARAEADEEGGGSPALTIFLVLVILLLAGAGGASYWAWREGYLDLSHLFGSSEEAVVSDTGTPAIAVAPITSEPETAPVLTTEIEGTEQSRPGNTAATPDVVETPATGLEQADAGSIGNTAGDAATPSAADTVMATQPTPTMDGTEAEAGNTVSSAAADAAANVAEPTAGEDKTVQRLPVAEDSTAVSEAMTETVTTPDVVTEGSQSLLLEASDQAGAGAIPFSGTVEWTRGVDEIGQPTLEAVVDIPARNMSVDLLIRKNGDSSLPASHLIEIDFTVSDSFIGGGIARVAGILMKNEELVQGVPLVGASARVVGNNFLFALSAANQDVITNNALLKSRKWMDLAIIYSTGKQAILTLEKDDAAVALFDEVLAVWTPAVE